MGQRTSTWLAEYYTAVRCLRNVPFYIVDQTNHRTYCNGSKHDLEWILCEDGFCLTLFKDMLMVCLVFFSSPQDVHWSPAVSHGSLCPRGVKTRRRSVNCLSPSSLVFILLSVFIRNTSCVTMIDAISHPNIIWKCLFFYSSVDKHKFYLYIFFISTDTSSTFYVLTL